MLLYSKNISQIFFRLIFVFLKWKIGVVASFFETKTDPNQTIKKADVWADVYLENPY